MPRAFIAATVVALAGVDLGATAQAQSQPLPSPIISPAPSSPALLISREATLRCDGRRVKPLYDEPLSPQFSAAPSLSEREASTHVLTFSVDADGRPRSIHPAPTNPPRLIQSDDAQATLAAYRFASGAPRANCAMTIRQMPRLLTEAGAERLAFAYAVDRSRPAALAGALAQDGDDCSDRDRPRPAVAGYPSPDAGRVPPGGRAWTTTRWNVDPEGRTTDIETIASSGHPEIDAEARRAVAATSFQPGGPRRGCINSWTPRGEPLTDTPEPEPTGDPLQNCPAELRARLMPGRTTYPPAFQRRSIEGWAIVRFDIASWGQTGAVEVLDAQPAAAFGDAARSIIRARQAPPGHVAGVRCIDRVIFRMADTDRAANTD